MSPHGDVSLVSVSSRTLQVVSTRNEDPTTRGRLYQKLFDNYNGEVAPPNYVEVKFELAVICSAPSADGKDVKSTVLEIMVSLMSSFVRDGTPFGSFVRDGTPFGSFVRDGTPFGSFVRDETPFRQLCQDGTPFR